MLGAVVVPEYDGRLSQLKSILVVFQNPGLASQLIPINLRAKFGAFVIEAELRTGVYKSLQRLDESRK